MFWRGVGVDFSYILSDWGEKEWSSVLQLWHYSWDIHLEEASVILSQTAVFLFYDVTDGGYFNLGFLGIIHLTKEKQEKS